MQKSSKIFRRPEMCSLGKILAQDFQVAAVTKMLMRRDKSIAPLLSLGDKQKTLEQKNAQKNAHGDCDAVAAVVTHESLSQEVGCGDEGLGLFGFNLSSAETGFWWLGEEQKEESKPIHGIDLGAWLQEKLENLSAAPPDELDHACREARDFATHFRVSYYMFLSIMEAAKPVFSVCKDCAY